MLTKRMRHRGLSLVELMVSIAVGLFVVMALSRFFVGQVAGNTDLLKATRLNQELRAIMDLTERDIRRGGYWGSAIRGVWYEGTTGVTANPLQSVTVGSTTDPSANATGNVFRYAYDVNGDGAIADAENFAIQLNAGNHSVELVQGIADPVSTTLSDTGTTVITDLSFSLAPAVVTVSCMAPGSNPTLTVRELTIALAGRLTSDASVSRSLQETVRLRSDAVTGACPPAIS